MPRIAVDKPSKPNVGKESPQPAAGVSHDLGTYVLRIWIVGMYAFTLWVTRRLWTEHVEPPVLPWIELPAFDGYGELLLATACLFVLWPRAGLSANVAVGLVAMAADQTRMQPQIFSFWLLMLGTWPQPTAQWLARCHLASLWFFSGLHKLLSRGYFEEVAPWLWQGVFSPGTWPHLPDWSRQFAGLLAAGELLLGAAVWFVPCRKPAAAAGLLLHCSIVALLYHMNGWNTSVWGWNLALAAAAVVLIGGWRTPLREELKRCGKIGLMLGVLLFLSPALFYVGRLDAYLCHCLYSANVSTATFFPGPESGGVAYHVQGLEGPYWRNLNVPQPPTHRNFEVYFRRVAKPGDSMEVVDPRDWARASGWGHYAWRRDGDEFKRIPLSQGGLAQE